MQRLLARVATCCWETRASDFESRKNAPNRITWDEAGIQKDMGERGVLYGTQTIDDPPTPFLLYDSHMSRAEQAVVEINDQGKAHVDIATLQARLGVLQQRQEQGDEVIPRAARNAAVEQEGQRRGEAGALLRGGGDQAAADAPGDLAADPAAFRRRRTECSAGAAMAFRAGLAQLAADQDEEDEENEEGNNRETEGDAAPPEVRQEPPAHHANGSGHF